MGGAPEEMPSEPHSPALSLPDGGQPATREDPYATRAPGAAPRTGPLPAEPDPGPYATRLPVPENQSAARRASSDMRYRALELHARGGLGQVSVAHDDELGREVALKEIQ